VAALVVVCHLRHVDLDHIISVAVYHTFYTGSLMSPRKQVLLEVDFVLLDYGALIHQVPFRAIGIRADTPRGCWGRCHQFRFLL
jgi:hypothetical protein